MDLSLKAFKEIKELEYIEDLKDYNLPFDTCIVIVPKISQKTEAGVIKSPQVVEEEMKEISRKPALCVKVGKTELNLKEGDKVYAIAEFRVLVTRFIKNALEEDFMMFLLPIREIAYYTR